MLLKQDQPWQWELEEQDAMQLLKELVSNAPCLVPLDCKTEAETILAVDSSHIAIGFVLYQLDQEGKRRPVHFGSLTFNEHESRYSQPKLELYGLYRALRKWRPYITSVCNLVVEVDVKYIQGMLNLPELVQNAIVGHWAEEILCYPFKLQHIRVANHAVPDRLSCQRCAPEDTESDESDWEQPGQSQIMAASRLDGWVDPGRTIRISMMVASETWEPELEEVRQWLGGMTCPSGISKDKARVLAKKAKGFLMIEGQLWRWRIDGQHQLIMLKECQPQTISQAHDELGHKGIWSMVQQLQLRVWWPRMEEDVVAFVRSCPRCQACNPQNVHLPVQVSVPTNPFRKIHADVVFLPKAHSYQAAVLMRDNLSGYIKGRCLRQVNTKSMGRFLWEDILTRWGAVAEIVTDNGGGVQRGCREPAQVALGQPNPNYRV
ncbi:hypothetical protein OPQ81_011066 [Rhizoctonia solani]|nr:hypothetical protein OPQ81_011066 [Rhizoctonia solani]